MKSAVIAWSLVAILTISLLVVSYLWYHAEQKSAQVIEYAGGSMSFEENRLKAECGRTDPEGEMACRRALNDLSRLMRDIQELKEEKSVAEGQFSL